MNVELGMLNVELGMLNVELGMLNWSPTAMLNYSIMNSKFVNS